MTGLFFFHLPKAGGISLRTALQGLFRPEECSPVIENDTIDDIRNGGNYHFARAIGSMQATSGRTSSRR